MAYALLLFLGGVTFGYQMGLPAPFFAILEDARPDVWKNDVDNHTTIVTVFSAIPSAAAVVAPFIMPLMLGHLSRRMSTWVLASCGALFNALMCAATSRDIFWVAIVARGLMGFVIGGLSTTNPMFMVEIAEPGFANVFGTMNQIGVTIGVILCPVIGTIHDHVAVPWQVIPIVGAVISGVLAIGVWWLPESPVDLRPKKEGFTGLKKEHVGPEIVLVLLAVFQQLSGINAILAYLTPLFNGVSKKITPNLGSVIADLGQIVATVAAAPLQQVVGPRVMWVISLGLCALANVLFGFGVRQQNDDEDHTYKWGFWMIVFVFIILLGFGLGCGPLPWYYGTIVFDEQTRVLANAIAGSVNWAVAFVVVMVMPILQKKGGMYPFFGFGGASAVALVFGLFFIKSGNDTEGEDSLATRMAE